MTIRVKGETYADAAELAETIERLGADHAAMPDGPAKVSLGAHIDELYSVLGGYATSGDGLGGSGDKAPGPPGASPLPPATDDNEGDETDTLLDGAGVVCPMCDGSGELAADPPDDPRATRCNDCDGWGKVYTGSRVRGHEVRDCPTCQGGGFVEPPTTVASPPPASRTAAEAPEAPGATWDAVNGNWMRPEGGQPPWPGATWDSFYGKWA